MDKMILQHGQLLGDALAAFAKDIRAALASKGLEYSIAISKWKKAELIIEYDLKTPNEALSGSDDKAKNVVIIVAGRSVGLMKNLDTFRLDFAGPVWEQKLSIDAKQVVSVASNVLSATSPH